MAIGRNTPCPCGSGKKFKKCCGSVTQTRASSARPDKYRFEPGSYGGPGAAYVPSILCQKRVSESEWRDHFVLANPESTHNNEDSAVEIAGFDLEEAFKVKSIGGTDADLAMHLKSKGYVSVTGFRVVSDEETADSEDSGYRH